MKLIDTHTGGEPTRVIVEGGPDLGNGPLSSKLASLAEQFDHIRTSVILEPRGYAAMVGALLCEATDKECVAGVIFFNNAGYLGMCGHGTIGVAVALYYRGQIGLGRHRFETPVGIVEVELLAPNKVRVQNVPSYCYRDDVELDVDGLGSVSGKVAWGGNWFFLVNEDFGDLRLQDAAALTQKAIKIQDALGQAGVTGKDGAEIDHIELYGTPHSAHADSRNFVLCPGGEYDRSPCGTGTSAKVACLAESGELQAGEQWIQESIVGSEFSVSYSRDDKDRIIPELTGHAYVCAETVIIEQDGDPFARGIQ